MSITAQDVFSTLTSALDTVSASAGGMNFDMSTPTLQAQGYAIALTALTGTRWLSAYSPAQSRYIVYPQDVQAVRKWVSLQMAKKSAVEVDWLPSMMPTILKDAIPIAGIFFGAGFLFRWILK